MQIKLYTTPGCRACASLKLEMQKSKYNEFLEIIDLTQNEEEMNFIREKGIMSVPTIGIFIHEKNMFDYITGARPVEYVDRYIEEAMKNAS